MPPHELQHIDEARILPGNGYLVLIDKDLFWLGIACSGDSDLEAEARSHTGCMAIAHSVFDSSYFPCSCLEVLLPMHDQNFRCVKRSSLYRLDNESLEIATNSIADQDPGSLEAFLSACEVWRLSLENVGETLAYWKSVLGLQMKVSVIIDEEFKDKVDSRRVDPNTKEDHALAMSLSKAEELEEELRRRRESSDRRFAEAVKVGYEEDNKEERQRARDHVQDDIEVIYTDSLPTPPSSQRPSIQLSEDAEVLPRLSSSKKRNAQELRMIQHKTKRVKTMTPTKKWAQKINPMMVDEFESECYGSSEDAEDESRDLSVRERNQVQRGILDDLRLCGDSEDFEGRQLTAFAGWSKLEGQGLSAGSVPLLKSDVEDTDNDESSYSGEEEEEEEEEKENKEEDDDDDDLSSEVSTSACVSDDQVIADDDPSTASSSSYASSVCSSANDKLDYRQGEQSRPDKKFGLDVESASNDTNKNRVTIFVGQKSWRTIFSLPKPLVTQQSPILTKLIQSQDGKDMIDDDILSNILPSDFKAVQSHVLSGEFAPILVENTSIGPEEFVIKPGWLPPIDRARFASLHLVRDECQINTISRLGRLLILGIKLDIKDFTNTVIEKLQYGFPYGYYCLSFLRFARDVLIELKKIDGVSALETTVAEIHDWIAKVLASRQTELAMDRSVVGNIYWNVIEKNSEIEKRLDGGRAKMYIGD